MNYKEKSIFELEDILINNNVSIYSKTGEKALLGAYGSTISWTAIQTVIKENKTLISKENWIEYIDHLDSCSYLSPVIKLLSVWLKRFIKIEYENIQ